MTSRTQPREVLRLMWPAAISASVFSLMEIVDALMLGLVALPAMAGTVLASTILYILLAFPQQTLKAVTPLTAGNSMAQRRRLLHISMGASLLLGIVVTGLTVAAGFLITKLGYEPAMAAATKTYLIHRAPAIPLELAFCAAWALLEGAGNTRTPMIAGFICNAVNVLLNILLIPGWFGLPQMGVAGAAWATNSAIIVGLIFLSRPVWRTLPAPSEQSCIDARIMANLPLWRRALRMLNPSTWCHSGDDLLKRFINLGWPLGLSGMMDGLGWLLIGLLIPRLGSVAAATHGVISRLISFGLAPSHGTQIAAVIVVSRALGRKQLDNARYSGRLTIIFNLVASIIVGIIVWAAFDLWMSLLNTEGEMITPDSRILPLVLAILLLEGVAIVLTGIIEGTGKTRTLLISTLLFDILFTTVGSVFIVFSGTLVSFYLLWLIKNILKVTYLYQRQNLSPPAATKKQSPSLLFNWRTTAAMQTTALLLVLFLSMAQVSSRMRSFILDHVAIVQDFIGQKRS